MNNKDCTQKNKNDCDSCEVAKKKKQELLENINDPIDAAISYSWFLARCKKTCPYTKERTN